MKQQQDRRLKPTQPENQPPQKCPRCDSLNTKFCYYNNYSLSQPRYFCKTCRRYWTQGGTLRNVPVGGGCRKGKRSKTSSNSSQNPSEVPPPQISSATGAAPRNKEPTLSLPAPTHTPISSYYSRGGFLSSFAAIQSMNQAQAFNQPINVGNFEGSSSNMALLQKGFNIPFLGLSQQNQQTDQFFQMGVNRDDQNISHHDWNQSFINSAISTAQSGAGLWSGNSSNNNNNDASGSLNPNLWPDLPGYAPPP